MNELAVPLMATAAKMADQVWSIRESALVTYLASRASVSRRTAPAALASTQSRIVSFTIEGVIVPDAMFEDETDVRQLAKAFERAAADDSIAGGVIYVNSPGGSTVGLAEAVESAKAFSNAKPLYAVVEGCCCSAAYRIVSQASAIYAGARDDIGSIGTRSLVYDWSKAYEAAGIEAISTDTGPIKSLGVIGTPVTDEQRAFLQERVDYLQEDFKRDVMSGRGLTDEEYAAVATGGYWFGEQAVGLKLIDGVGTRQSVLAAITAAVNTPSTTGRQDMADVQETVEAPKAATSKEIKAKFPNSTAEFREEMTEQGATLADVAVAWAEHCEKRLADETAAREEAEAEAAKARAEKAEAPKSSRGVPSVNGIESSEAGAEDAVQSWRDLVAACSEKCGGDRAKGFSMARRKNPELARAAREACLSA